MKYHKFKMFMGDHNGFKSDMNMIKSLQTQCFCRVYTKGKIQLPNVTMTLQFDAPYNRKQLNTLYSDPRFSNSFHFVSVFLPIFGASLENYPQKKSWSSFVFVWNVLLYFLCQHKSNGKQWAWCWKINTFHNFSYFSMKSVKRRSD